MADLSDYFRGYARDVGVNPTIAGADNVQDALVAAIAASFPDFTGDGSPEGVQAAALGKSYVDTTNGALYWKLEGDGLNTGWVIGVGFSVDADMADGIVGVMYENDDITIITAIDGAVHIQDLNAFSGTGNNWEWNAESGDGAQYVGLKLGPAGEFIWRWNADGKTILPGSITTVPLDSYTATAAFGAVAVDTPIQNVLGYDVMVTGIIKVTAATAGTLALGVGPTATPTTDPLLTATTAAALVVVPFSAVVPNDYYLSLVSGGTITVASTTGVVTPL